MLRRFSVLSFVSLSLLLSGCAESFVQNPHSDTQFTPLTQTPTLISSDGFSQKSGIAFRRNLTLDWNVTMGASSWCVSETQNEPPVLACDGGQGELGGWSTSAPRQFVLSDGLGAKLIYVWVRDLEGSLIAMPSVSTVVLMQASALVPFADTTGTSVTELMGLPITFQKGIAGRWLSNKAIELDGNSSYLDLGMPSALRFTGSFTILTWVKSFQASGQILLGRYDPFTNNKGYHFHFTPSALNFEISKDGSTSTGRFARVTAPYVAKGFQNRWKHLAAVYQAKTDGTSVLSLYVDGIKVDETQTAPGSVYDSSTTPVLMGIASDRTSYPVSGQIGATAFIPAPINETILQAIYAAQKPNY